jgi:hypothetical protein
VHKVQETRKFYSSFRGPHSSKTFLDILLTNMSTGSTWRHGNSSSVQLDLHGLRSRITGGSTFSKRVFTYEPRFKSRIKMVPPYNSLTFIQVPLLWCPACCRHSSHENTLLQLTSPSLWKLPSLACIYHFLSIRTGSSSVEAFQGTLLTRLSRVEPCLASEISLSCAPGLTTLKNLSYHDGSSYHKEGFPSGQMKTSPLFP